MADRKRYWVGTVDVNDDLGVPIDDVFIDGRTIFGPWGRMAPATHKQIGCGLGSGRGQMYQKQPDGRWLKVG